MNQRQAFRETLILATQHGMQKVEVDDPSLGYYHLVDMWDRIDANPNMSEAKLGRWLGWAQAAVVAACVGVTLTDIKLLNQKWADD